MDTRGQVRSQRKVQGKESGGKDFPHVKAYISASYTECVHAYELTAN